jgi:hypothetical protein
MDERGKEIRTAFCSLNLPRNSSLADIDGRITLKYTVTFRGLLSDGFWIG